MSYGIFSSVYDILTENVEYEKIADSICSLLHKNGVDGGLLLDLGCGTGTLSFLLEKNGYDVIGVDASEDMLMVANEKKYEENSSAMFLCQKGEELDLYGTINCAVSILDTINHIEKLENVEKTFSRVSLFMEMGGIFVFDMNTPYKHENILGNNTFIYDMDEVYCAWQNSFDKESGKTQIDLDFFIKNDDDNCYEKYSESFCEYSYSVDDILKIINKTGFTLLEMCDDYSDKDITSTTERITFVCKKTETIFKDELK
ncbi:MAG: class I SAM-dependent methyltransferase [Clostridia bacterium]|nr:class I SAM-dependent methyltransferase [Clostridia bacterium]